MQAHPMIENPILIFLGGILNLVLGLVFVGGGLSMIMTAWAKATR